MKIYAPVKDFNGLRNNVRFVRGVGETDNPIAIAWFKSHGYRVEDNSHIATVEITETPTFTEVVKPTETVKSSEPDFDNMTPTELRDWAIANGLGGKIRNTRNKEKLLEIIRG